MAAWNEIIEIIELDDITYIITKYTAYKIEPNYSFGGWNIFEVAYHKQRFGRPLKKKRSEQIPRWKKIDHKQEKPQYSVGQLIEYN